MRLLGDAPEHNSNGSTNVTKYRPRVTVKYIYNRLLRFKMVF